MSRLTRTAARLRDDCRGVSAVEFALVAPFLIVLYFGLAELSQALTAKRRVSHAAAAAGDLVAQTRDTLNLAALDDVFIAGRTLMTPFDSKDLTVRITSVTGDANGLPKVDWSDSEGPDVALKPRTTRSISLPSGLITAAGETVILAEATYTYNPVVSVTGGKGFTFSDRFYLRPRVLSKVDCSNCVKPTS